MTFPAIIYGIILSTVYGTAFHFWKGGSLNRLFLYVLLSWLGFWAGQLVQHRRRPGSADEAPSRRFHS